MELDASRVPFWHPLHCGVNGWNWMLHVCLSGISSIVAVMDGTGCFTCAFLASPPLWRIWMELDASRVPFWHLLHCGGNGWNWMITGHKKYTLRSMETHKISRLTII